MKRFYQNNNYTFLSINEFFKQTGISLFVKINHPLRSLRLE